MILSITQTTAPHVSASISVNTTELARDSFDLLCIEKNLISANGKDPNLPLLSFYQAINGTHYVVFSDYGNAISDLSTIIPNGYEQTHCSNLLNSITIYLNRTHCPLAVNYPAEQTAEQQFPPLPYANLSVDTGAAESGSSSSIPRSQHSTSNWNARMQSVDMLETHPVRIPVTIEKFPTSRTSHSTISSRLLMDKKNIQSVPPSQNQPPLADRQSGQVLVQSIQPVESVQTDPNYIRPKIIAKSTTKKVCNVHHSHTVQERLRRDTISTQFLRIFALLGAADPSPINNSRLSALQASERAIKYYLTMHNIPIPHLPELPPALPCSCPQRHSQWGGKKNH